MSDPQWEDIRVIDPTLSKSLQRDFGSVTLLSLACYDGASTSALVDEALQGRSIFNEQTSHNFNGTSCLEPETRT